MAKSFFAVALFLLLSLTVVALELPDVVNKYESYIGDYNSDVSALPKIIQLKSDLNDLALYRLYKIQMVGSTEKKESTTTIDDLLTKHFESLDLSMFNGKEDRIAYSAFLAWINATLVEKTLQLGTLNEMPAYASAYNEYTTEIRSNATRVYNAWLMYALGTIPGELASFPASLPKTGAFPEFEFKYDFDPEVEGEIVSLTTETIIERLSVVVEMLSVEKFDEDLLFKEEVERFATQAVNDLPDDTDKAIVLLANDLFKSWIYKSLSLLEDAPYYPESLPSLKKDVKGFSPDISIDPDIYIPVMKILEDQSILSSIVEKISMASRFVMLKKFSPEKLLETRINDEAKKLIPLLLETLGEQKNEISEALVSASPKSFSFGWLRVLVYIAIVFGVLFFLPRFKKYLLHLIVILESFYMLFLSNIQSTFDIAVYSIIIIPVFVFTTILLISSLVNKKKRRKITWLYSAITLLSIILPLVSLYNNVPELGMDEFPEFYNSIYYDSLKKDVFASQDSKLNVEIRAMGSIISSELNDMKRNMKVVIPNYLNDASKAGGTSFTVDNNGRLRVNVPAFSEYFSIENEKEYIADLENLQKAISSFERSSKGNYKRYIGARSKVVETTSQIIRYAGATMRQDLEKFLTETISARPEYNIAMDDIDKGVENIKTSKPLSAVIKPYRVQEFTVILIATLLLVSSLVIFKGSVLSLIQIGLILIALIKSVLGAGFINLFVHSGSPTLNIDTNTGISFWFLIVFISIIVLSTITVVLSQKRGRERI